MSEVIRRPKIHQPVDDLVDVWKLHSEGDRREIPTVISFAHYALSPSTVRVVFALDRDVPATGEIRAYGPKDQLVWLSVSPSTSRHDGKMIAGLFKEINKIGKLSVL